MTNPGFKNSCSVIAGTEKSENHRSLTMMITRFKHPKCFSLASANGSADLRNSIKLQRKSVLVKRVKVDLTIARNWISAELRQSESEPQNYVKKL